MKTTLRVLFIELMLSCIMVGIFPVASMPTESGWNEIGIRSGIQASFKHAHFQQHEAFAAYGLPWEWREFYRIIAGFLKEGGII